VRLGLYPHLLELPHMSTFLFDDAVELGDSFRVVEETGQEFVKPDGVRLELDGLKQQVFQACGQAEPLLLQRECLVADDVLKQRTAHGLELRLLGGWRSGGNDGIEEHAVLFLFISHPAENTS